MFGAGTDVHVERETQDRPGGLVNARRTFTSVAVAGIAALSAVLTAPAPADAASSVRFSRIWYDSPGSDTRTNSSINSEYAIIHNYSTTTRSLTGWTVRDAANHVYTFGSFSLGAGKSVVLRTGKGTNTSSTRYWGYAIYVWNNDRDTGYLRNKSGTLLDTCAYNSTAYDYTNC